MMSHTLKTKTGFRSFSTTLAALRGHRDRRIPVQLLQDFEGVGACGEVVQVPSGFMRNKLHRGGGAAYVLKGQPLRIPEVRREDILAAQAAQKATEAREVAELQEQRQKEESRLRTSRSVSEESMRAALEGLGLTNDLFKSGAAKDSEIPDSSYHTESTLRSLPPVIVLHKPALESGFLASRDHITLAALAKHLSILTGVEVAPALLSFPVSASQTATAVDFVGDSEFKIEFSDSGNSYTRTLRVIPDKETKDFMAMKRPAEVPFPGTSDAQKAEQELGHDAAASKALAKDAAKVAAPAAPKSQQQKEFEWENDFLDEMTKR